jgi:hypothetical protein
MTTVAAALAAARAKLPASEARLLLGQVMRQGPAWLIAHDDELLDEDTLLAFAALVARRGRWRAGGLSAGLSRVFRAPLCREPGRPDPAPRDGTVGRTCEGKSRRRRALRTWQIRSPDAADPGVSSTAGNAEHPRSGHRQRLHRHHAGPGIARSPRVTRCRFVGRGACKSRAPMRRRLGASLVRLCSKRLASPRLMANAST